MTKYINTKPLYGKYGQYSAKTISLGPIIALLAIFPLDPFRPGFQIRQRIDFDGHPPFDAPTGGHAHQNGHHPVSQAGKLPVWVWSLGIPKQLLMQAPVATAVPSTFARYLDDFVVFSV